MKGLIGKKVGMTQVYDEKGVLVGVTVIQAGPCVVLGHKTKEKDGYSALQLGYGSRKAKNVVKPVMGQYAKVGRSENPPSIVREIRIEADPVDAIGAEIKADIFAVNEYLDVTGVIKGRGFQGVVKRHGFAGGRASHGRGWIRKGGSIGQKEWPGNVAKNKKMAGQTGNVSRTTQNLKIVRVSPEENLIFVKGAVPGANGGALLVKAAKKKQAAKAKK